MTQAVRTPLILATLATVSCGGGEPTRSYCEALCDWSVDCHAGERSLDADARHADCLAATHAVDDSCMAAENGEANPAAIAALEPCVSAVDAAASDGECSAFTGSIDELKQGTTPTQCATQGTDAQATFDAARLATQETGDELCDRLSTTFCERTDTCILGDVGGQIPQSVTDAMGGTPFELCVQRLDPVFTSDCQTNSLYVAEQTLDDVNPPRQAARTCLGDFSTTACADLFAGQLSETCVAAFSDPQDLVDIALTLVSLADEVQAAVNGGTTGTTTTGGTTTGTTTGT